MKNYFKNEIKMKENHYQKTEKEVHRKNAFENETKS